MLVDLLTHTHTQKRSEQKTIILWHRHDSSYWNNTEFNDEHFECRHYISPEPIAFLLILFFAYSLRLEPIQRNYSKCLKWASKISRTKTKNLNKNGTIRFFMGYLTLLHAHCSSYSSWFNAWRNTDGSQIAKFIFILCLFKVLCASWMCVFSAFEFFFCGQLLNISHPQHFENESRASERGREIERARRRVNTSCKYITDTIIIHAFNAM